MPFSNSSSLTFLIILLSAIAAPQQLLAGNPDSDIRMVRSEFIQPVPYPTNLNPGKVALGDALFHDTRLSKDNTISCASCHGLDSGGVDGVPRSFGVNGAEGDINTPTVFNSGLNYSQFWDGRAASLEEQINGPINNPKEMASNWPLVISRLKEDPAYVSSFASIYDDGISADNVRDAIATFERSLNVVDSRFDQYLRGDKDAISKDELRGYGLFKSYGCVACHQGQNVGGNMFQKYGVLKDVKHGPVSKVDFGRFNATGDEHDRYVFRVPSLRLVVLTAPYFHDGSAKTLHDAIYEMAEHQLGRAIPDEDEKLIIKFLHSLVGSYQGKALDE